MSSTSIGTVFAVVLTVVMFLCMWKDKSLAGFYKAMEYVAEGMRL